jgi:hypothetical protein
MLDFDTWCESLATPPFTTTADYIEGSNMKTLVKKNLRLRMVMVEMGNRETSITHVGGLASYRVFAS